MLFCVLSVPESRCRFSPCSFRSLLVMRSEPVTVRSFFASSVTFPLALAIWLRIVPCVWFALSCTLWLFDTPTLKPVDVPLLPRLPIRRLLDSSWLRFVSSPASTLTAPWSAVTLTSCVPLTPDPMTFTSPVRPRIVTLSPDTTVAVWRVPDRLPSEFSRLALYGERPTPSLFAVPLIQRTTFPRLGNDRSARLVLELLECVFC